MPAFTVTASIRINASVEAVHKAIADFNTWPIWSPWLCMERTATVDYHDEPATVGHGYKWAGQKVGEGAMEWVQIAPNQLTAKLTFLKPFKSTANTHFNVDAAGKSTDVEWVMNSSLPFFMVFWVGQFKAMIKMDYKRGLSMLKDYVEAGEVHSRLMAEGTVEMQAMSFLGVSSESALDDIAASMERSFSELNAGLSASGIAPQGPPITVYHKMDIKQAQCRYTAALPVRSDDGKQHATLDTGETPAGKAFKVVHTGPYRHLGNAWALALSDMRHAKLKANKRLAPFERYVNDPTDTAEQDLITEIFVPLR